jgi:peptidoglycan/xylan/chitin deacetylase (PgdA/CDA1 family)
MLQRLALVTLLLAAVSFFITRAVTGSKQAEINRLTSAEIDQAKQFNQKIVTAAPSGYFAPILTFHHVAPLPPGADRIEKNLHVLPEEFEQMLVDLQKSNYQLVFTSDIISYLARGERPPQKMVALTFDDGYEDFYTEVFPLLKKYNIKASLYVITADSGGVYLTHDQLKELDASGLVEIGSHTVDHPNLASLPPAKQLEELRKSKETLDVLLNKDIKIICYPYGSYTKQTEALARQAGYQYGLTYNHRPLRDSGDLLAIDRVGVWSGMKVVKFLDDLNKVKK